MYLDNPKDSQSEAGGFNQPHLTSYPSYHAQIVVRGRRPQRAYVPQKTQSVPDLNRNHLPLEALDALKLARARQGEERVQHGRRVVDLAKKIDNPVLEAEGELELARATQGEEQLEHANRAVALAQALDDDLGLKAEGERELAEAYRALYERCKDSGETYHDLRTNNLRATPNDSLAGLAASSRDPQQVAWAYNQLYKRCKASGETYHDLRTNHLRATPNDSLASLAASSRDPQQVAWAYRELYERCKDSGETYHDLRTNHLRATPNDSLAGIAASSRDPQQVAWAYNELERRNAPSPGTNLTSAYPWQTHYGQQIPGYDVGHQLPLQHTHSYRAPQQPYGYPPLLEARVANSLGYSRQAVEQQQQSDLSRQDPIAPKRLSVAGPSSSWLPGTTANVRRGFFEPQQAVPGGQTRVQRGRAQPAVVIDPRSLRQQGEPYLTGGEGPGEGRGAGRSRG